MRYQFRIEKLHCPVGATDDVCISYVDSSSNDPSIRGGNAHVDSKYKNLDNVRFVTTNGIPAVR